jgi:glycerophosphoryl diester phosphodiesterase
MAIRPVVYLDNPTAKSVIDEYQKEIKPVAFVLICAKDKSGILAQNTFILNMDLKFGSTSYGPA